ncbi:S-layer homology domain-containing protein [Leucobacter sp. HY1908]
MSRPLRTLTAAALAIVLGAGLVGQLGLTAPAFATDTAASGRTDAGAASAADASAAASANASANASAGSAADGASDAAADGGAGAGSDAGAGAGADAGTGADASAGANSGADAGADAGAASNNAGGSEAGENNGASGGGTGADSGGAGDTDGKPDDKQIIDEAEGARLKAASASDFAGLKGAAMLSDFKAGNIINDANFYYGNALSAGQIQSFLARQVPKCLIGTPGKIAGGPAILDDGANVGVVGPHCLVNMRLDTSTQTSLYCKPYAGARGESAAQIISKVSRACDISPKILLVFLEKEQSLVTDDWPTVRQLNYATGANCPDSGPGNTANCDPGAKGFAVQVYKAAQLLRWYESRNGLNYHPGQVNKISWHEKVDRNCGTSNVDIENMATASLYTYTPYRPNKAALDAGWGTGDRCSSYGNRNVFLFYNLWFGSPQTRFPDVPDSHKFYKEIEWMAQTKLTTGNQTSHPRVSAYQPGSGVTREAMAAFLYRLEKSKYKGPAVSPFEDVQPGDKFYDEITWMYNEGVSTGNNNPGGKPKFAPKDNVSREAMAAFLYRFQESSYAGMATSPFADIAPGHKFYKEITWMRKQGLSYGNKQPSGKPTYAPYSAVSREAMAAFIYRLKH